MRVRLSYLFTLLFLLVLGCREDCPENYFLHDAFKAEISAYSYCNELNLILKGDSTLFNDFVGKPLNSGLAIDHGNNVCELVLELGKDRVCEWIDIGVVDPKMLGNALRLSNYNVLFEKRDEFFTETGEFNCHQ